MLGESASSARPTCAHALAVTAPAPLVVYALVAKLTAAQRCAVRYILLARLPAGSRAHTIAVDRVLAAHAAFRAARTLRSSSRSRARRR